MKPLPDDPIDLFLWVCERPGMYVSSTRFEAVWSFIEGFDWANDLQPLHGFREWLVVREGRFSNASWYHLVMAQVAPELNRPGARIPKELDEVLIERALELLKEYRQVRDTQALEQIISRYFEMGGMSKPTENSPN